MKSLTLISTATLCLAAMSCSTAASPPADTGGSTSTSTGGSGNTGNTSGGSVSTSGGSVSTSGGSVSTSGGSVSTSGGSLSSLGGGDASLGGSTSGGSGGGTVSGGAGGSTAAGGSSGTTSAGGSGGSTGGPITVAQFAGKWDGALLQFPCDSGANTNYDCPQPSEYKCKNATAATGAFVIPQANADTNPNTWTMGGDPGTTYNVTMHVEGVVEVSWYHNGTRAAGTSSITVQPRNTFQVGGTALTYTQDNGNGFDYNQYELDVTPAGSSTPALYFLNSVIPSENPHTNTTTQHLTFDVNYTVTIKITGGSTVKMTVRDSNCVEVQNCGTSSQSSCMGPRSMTFASDDPPPPSTWNGKVTTGKTNGQFIHFDITAVVAQ